MDEGAETGGREAALVGSSPKHSTGDVRQDVDRLETEEPICADSIGRIKRSRHECAP